MDGLKRSVAAWAEGSPPMDDDVFKAISDEFSVLLYLSCIFLDLRPKHRTASCILITTVLIGLTLYITAAIVTLYKQTEVGAQVLSFEMIILILFGIVCIVIYNLQRPNLSNFFRLVSSGYFDYKDGEDIPEMEAAMKSSRRQKIFIFVIPPVYLSATALIVVVGKSIDSVAGYTYNSSYVDGVYMLTPVPAWFPFRVETVFDHWLVVSTQVITAGVLAGFYIGYMGFHVICFQSLVLQLKLLTYRIRKINIFAYNLYKKRGGGKLRKRETYDNDLYRQCYNEYLSKCAAHHAAIVRGFNYIQETNKWVVYFALAGITGMMAMSLLMLVMGGKPSVVTAGLMLLIDEFVDLTIICWQAEQIKELADALPHELYNSSWPRMGKQASKTMMIICEKSKESLIFTSAVSKTPITWGTWAAILNKAYSYVNFISAANKND